MRLQKQLRWRGGGNDHAEWRVVIPPNVADKLGWAEGEDLEAGVEACQLHLKRVRQPKGGA